MEEIFNIFFAPIFPNKPWIEVRTMKPIHCKWSYKFRAFQRIQTSDEHKSLLKYRNDKNQSIFDIADAGMDQSMAIKLRRHFMEKP
jgi:hypothetical protein